MEEQDLLLASSGRAPGTRHLLLPARSFLRCWYSSVLPYRVGDDQIMFGARAPRNSHDHRGDLTDLEAIATEGNLRFDILAADLTGEWEVIGSLQVEDRCDPETSRTLRFNPWHSHPDLHPAGPLNTLRRSAYPASQEARPDT